jgi:hypothetical protein
VFLASATFAGPFLAGRLFLCAGHHGKKPTFAMLDWTSRPPILPRMKKPATRAQKTYIPSSQPSR